MRIPSRREAISAQKDRGMKIAAVFPIHYPRALLLAHEVLPVEVWGPPRTDESAGAAHLQPYVCSIVRNAVSFVTSSDSEPADLFVVPHGCDSLQGLGSILLDLMKVKKPTIPIYIPKGSRKEDVEFLAKEIETFGEKLSLVTGENPDPEKIRSWVEEDEKARHMARKLFKRRRKIPISNEQFYRVLRSMEYLLPTEFSAIAEETLKLDGEAADGIPIIISGVVPEPASLLSALDELGALIVGDDTACCGRRLYPGGTSREPLTRIAESIIHGPPDSMRGATVESRAERIIAMVEETGAKGILFHLTKFCEPELFYLPLLRERLKKEGIPSITVEVDIGDPLSEQTMNRISAFLEMLR